MKKWKLLSQWQMADGKWQIDDIIALLMSNRGIKTEQEKEEYLTPNIASVTPKNVDIDLKQLKKTLTRIAQAIEKQEQIIVYGDYDVDGITGTAILWETLYALGAKVAPYIPHRVDEGYGLSVIGIKNLSADEAGQELRIKEIKLIITVDNGIVAQEAVAFANEQGIDVIITDHHAAGEKQPDAFAIVHTTKLCGAGVAYLLSQELRKTLPSPPLSGRETGSSPDKGRLGGVSDSHLELVTLGTIADLVPLTGANRTIVKYGLPRLSQTRRPGLKALFRQAKITNEDIGTYEVGYIIGPRLNAAGRLESGMDSLRLLCTKDKKRAEALAEKLELTNKERQEIMKAAAEHAITNVKSQNANLKSILIVSHESYQEGVIGLIAGKLVEAFYRPAIVIAKREKQSKASVRSIAGFNIIEFLRSHNDLFVNVGGHPMAAGFTIETEKITVLQETLETNAESLITEDILLRELKIDCELPLAAIDASLYTEIQQLAPFGMANPEPVFATKGVTIEDMRIIGREGNHLKLILNQEPASTAGKVRNKGFDGIAFGLGELAGKLTIGDKIDIAYTIDENTWNGRTKLQLKIKDIKV